eukprot:NODE_217_length_14216_cov_0.430545.p5 type:complete len:353 gc:universal NODE_217_length_14216_cov_0.430545:5931-6989(+)
MQDDFDDMLDIEKNMKEIETLEDEEYTENPNMGIGSMYHGKPVYAVHFHNDKFFSGGEDEKVVAWRDDIIWERVFKDSVVEIKSSESRVAIACMDGDILVIENKNEIKELYLVDGPNEIICIYFKNKVLMAGCQDGLIWVWKDDVVLNVLSGHSGPVTKLDTNGNNVVSCSEDATIIIWDAVQNAIIHKLDHGHFAHITPIVSLIMLNGCITGDANGKIVLSNNGKVSVTVHHHQDSVECLDKYESSMVVSADVSGKLVIWDIVTQLARSSTILDTVITCMQVDDHFVYVGCQDGIIRKFNILTGELVFEYHGHAEQILCLLVTCEHIISGSDDGNSLIFLKDHSQYDSEEL